MRRKSRSAVRPSCRDRYHRLPSSLASPSSFPSPQGQANTVLAAVARCTRPRSASPPADRWGRGQGLLSPPPSSYSPRRPPPLRPPPPLAPLDWLNPELPQLAIEPMLLGEQRPPCPQTHMAGACELAESVGVCVYVYVCMCVCASTHGKSSPSSSPSWSSVTITLRSCRGAFGGRGGMLWPLRCKQQQRDITGGNAPPSSPPRTRPSPGAG
jgi:hypothetical protein